MCWYLYTQTMLTNSLEKMRMMTNCYCVRVVPDKKLWPNVLWGQYYWERTTEGKISDQDDENDKYYFDDHDNHGCDDHWYQDVKFFIKMYNWGNIIGREQQWARSLIKMMRRNTDMIFVQNFTQPDFQAKSFTPQKCVIRDIFLAN